MQGGMKSHVQSSYGQRMALGALFASFSDAYLITGVEMVVTKVLFVMQGGSLQGSAQLSPAFWVAMQGFRAEGSCRTLVHEFYCGVVLDCQRRFGSG